MSEPESRSALRAAARAYLEWEAELSGFGVPELSTTREVVAQGTTHEPPPVVPATAAPAPAVMAMPSAPMPSAPVPSVSAPESTPQVSPVPSAPPARDVPVPIASPPRDPAPPAPAAPRDPSRWPSDPRPELRDEPTTAVRASLAALGAQADAPAESGDRHLRLTQLAEQVRSCVRCELAKGRRQTVFARGNPDAALVFIGEGPGQEEDRVGLPFVGPAGKLLDRMIAAMGFGRDDVYVCNVVKCRPPGNRTPLPSEAGACAPFLIGQLDVVQPKVIVALGRCATENLGLVGGGPWRGRWGTFRGVPVMPTYHPAFLLRSPEFKRPVWEDLQKVMGRLKEIAGSP